MVLNQIARVRTHTQMLNSDQNFPFHEFHGLRAFMCRHSSTDGWWTPRNQAFESS